MKMSDTFSSNRILKNSILLYGRMLFTVFLNLYATRLTLQNLGIDDMGVYGVTGSIVGMFTLLSSGIGNAVERFITFELGVKNGKPNEVFCVSLSVILLLAFALVVLLESIGLWFLEYKVNIPEGSSQAAFWSFQFSVLTCIINLISIPYNVLIVAHEKMGIFAAISIVQSALTCFIAWAISVFEERLICYALFVATISIGIRVFYQLYCRYHFPESIFHWKIDRDLMLQLSKYTGITTVAGTLQMLSGQGIVLFINWAFGVALNGVYTIAMQVKNSTQSFAFNLQRAISPQITKNYASGEIERYKKLTYSGSKMEVFLFYFILFPFLFRTPYIMHLWLGDELPPYIIEFVRSTVFIGLIYAAIEPIRIAIYATNRILRFMLLPEMFFLLVLPLSFVVNYLTRDPVWVIGGIVFMEALTAILRVYLGTKVSVLRLRNILKDIIYPVVIVALVSACLCYLLDSLFQNDLIGFLLFFVLNCCGLILVVYFLGLSRSERKLIDNALLGLWRKLRH